MNSAALSVTAPMRSGRFASSMIGLGALSLLCLKVVKCGVLWEAFEESAS